MNQKQGIFSMWLKNFCCLVFTQSFQAIFLAVIVLVMGTIIEDVSSVKLNDDFVGFVTGNDQSIKYFICSIVAYAGVTGLIKLDKLVRAIFGIDDSPLFGDLSKEMHKLLHAGLGFAKIGSDMKRGVSNVRESKARYTAASNATKRIANNTGRINTLAAGSGANKSVNNTNINVSGGAKGYTRDQIAALFNNDNNFDKNGNYIDRGDLGNQMLYDAQVEEINARRALSDSRRKAAVTALSSVAGLGIASGAFDDIDEIATAGAVFAHGIGKAGNVATKGISNRSARMTGAKSLRNAQNLVNQATEENRKVMEKNAAVMSEAIADATRDVSKEFKVPSVKEIPKAAKKAAKDVDASIRKAADDWLNTDLSTDSKSRIDYSKAKRNVVDNARKHKEK